MKIEKLEEYNEWWFNGKVPEELTRKHKREVFKNLVSSLNKRQITSIVGLRRTGKTTLLYQLMELLLERHIERKNIFYFSFDEKTEFLDDVINAYREMHNIDFRKEKIYIFFDEIQKLDNWPDKIKKYYDLYPKIKFIISGSESFFLSSKTKEGLAGRIYEFLLNPLSFKEYINFIGIKDVPESKMKALFFQYINNGGFPEVIGKNQQEIKMYIKSAVIDKIIFQDIVKFSGIKDTDLLKILIEVIAANPGMYLEYQSLAKQFDRDRRLIKSYISLLESSFLVKILNNYRKGTLSSLRKTKRIYLTDTSIIISYKGIVDEQFFGRLVESAVINSSGSNFFWKNSHEVDLIDKKPIEIKYKSKIIDKDMLGLRECMRKFSFKEGLMLSKDEEAKIKVPEGTIIIKPVWKFLFEQS